MLDGVRTLAELDLEHRRVLVRVDWDVVVTDGGVTDDTRIRRSLPTLLEAVSRGARLLIAAHASPAGPKPPSLEPFGLRLAELTGWVVHLPEDVTGDGPRKLAADLRPGQVVLLENLDSDPGEQEDGDRFARALSDVCDVYVNDAFVCSLDQRASIRSLPRLIADRGCGLAFERELAALGKVATSPDGPFVAVLGGDDVQEMIDLAGSLLGRADTLAIGGGAAATFFAAQGRRLGATEVRDDRLAAVRTLMERAQNAGAKMLLPLDFVVAGATSDASGRAVGAASVAPGEIALDIGPRTVEQFSRGLVGAGTILLGGAMGFDDNPAFAAGTDAMALAIADSAAFTVAIGQGARAAERAGVEERFGHVSRGERAATALIAGRRLPGVEALRA